MKAGPTTSSVFLDGALLVDLWGDLVLPAELRAAWQQVIDRELPT